MAEPKHLLDSVALAACEFGYGHCHIVSAAGEVVRDAAVEKSEAFDIVGRWEYSELVLLEVPANNDAAAWLYLRCNAEGEVMSEAVQFVSLKPDLIRSMQSVH